MAAGLVELQHAINRSYARMVHQSTNARPLTAQERQKLQFKAKVERGCTLITVDLSEFSQRLIQSMVDKMGPEQLVIMVVGMAAVGGSLLAYKAFLRQRTEDKKIDAETQQRIALSQEETRRLEIMAKAQRAYPELAHARQDFDAARHEIVRGIGDAKTLAVNTVELDRDSARLVATAKRSETIDIQLNGTYHIKKTDWQQDDEVRLKVVNVDTGREFVASFQDRSLDGEQLKLLQQAEWNRRRVYMSINATELRGEITTAVIVRVAIQPG